MSTRPNILLIHWHDTGRHLGAYGHDDVISPHIDQLAADGIRFDQAYSTAPLCSPARGSLFTGRYPHSNGLMGLSHTGWEYHSNERTLATELGRLGYRTTLIGLQHESSDPRTIGFDEVQNLAAPEQYCWAVSELASVYLRNRAADDQPFFLTVGMFEPHRPYPEALYDYADPQSIEVPGYLPDVPEVRYDLAGFVGAVETADAATGMVLRVLDQTGLADNTIVVFTTDHGIAFPGAKSTLHDPGIEVALVIRMPGGIGSRNGENTTRLVSHVDVMPTLLELVGATADVHVQGQSFAGWIGGDDGPGREAVYAEKNWHDPDQYDPVRCVRTEQFKYIRSWEERPELLLSGDIASSPSASATAVVERTHRRRPPVELYDVLADPWETNNLAGVAEYASVEADLDRALTEWQTTTQDPLLYGPIRSPRTDGILQRSITIPQAVPPYDGTLNGVNYD